MSQLGWASASSGVARARLSASASRNGPPDAVNTTRQGKHAASRARRLPQDERASDDEHLLVREGDVGSPAEGLDDRLESETTDERPDDQIGSGPSDLEQTLPPR
jgi:hypothetical protein